MASAEAASPATVLLVENGTRRQRITVENIGGVKYIALSSLGRVLGTFRPPDECVVAAARVRWSAPGFFVSVMWSNSRRVVQSMRPAVLRGDAVLVPLDECMQILGDIGLVAWDRSQNRLRVIAPNPPRQTRQAPRYGLPPLLRRPSIERLQRSPNESRMSVRSVSPLLAALGSVPVLLQDSIASVIRTELRIVGDTTRIVFVLSAPLHGEQARLERTGDHLAVRLPGVRCSRAMLEPLRRIRLRSFAVEQDEEGAIIRLRLRRARRSARLLDSDRQRVILEIAPSSSVSQQPSPWAFDCVVLDAGHGGRDVGAIGVRGTLEKHVTLAVVHKVARHVRGLMPSVRVVLTRSEDRFVELHERSAVANRAGGKLFVSLHCNAAPSKPHPARGVEVYVLSPARTDEAAAVAARENASIRLEHGGSRYRDADVERRILASVTQRGFLDLSHRCAALLDSSITRRLQCSSRGVQSAGFLVLVDASMPSVLVEMGFLTNREEERLLRSPSYQEKLARAIADAIVVYARQYERMVTSGNDHR